MAERIVTVKANPKVADHMTNALLGAIIAYKCSPEEGVLSAICATTNIIGALAQTRGVEDIDGFVIDTLQQTINQIKNHKNNNE